MTIEYTIEKNLSVDDFANVLNLSGLGERRPVHDKARLQEMIDGAQIMIVAKDADKIVGVARAITDYAYSCYLSDLAVAKEYQSQGIGKRLITEVHKVAGERTTLILISAPAAVDYYNHIGMKSFPGFGIKRSV
jgi:ribosomal protein S18 acetylase RimI-like enzyme